MPKIRFIDKGKITNKRVLLRADFDVPLTGKLTIANDFRIRQNIPTIKTLLKNHNRLICIAKLGRPKEKDARLSLKIVTKRLQKYLPGIKIRLVSDFLNEPRENFTHQDKNEIIVLENIRFYPQEKRNEREFAERLSQLGDVYVNDGFAMCHRAESSIVGIPEFLPSYGGLQLKREIAMIQQATTKPRKPLVAIIGGAKISTKIALIRHLIEIANYVLLGGGLANVFFRAQRYLIGRSICEYEMTQKARQLMYFAAQKNTAIILPSDVLIGDPKDIKRKPQVIQAGQKFPRDLSILDIGPDSQKRFAEIITGAKTIIWNGPVGLVENPAFRSGTNAIYTAITKNNKAVSVVGGGDTLRAIEGKPNFDKITHVSTGGGAMLELIENGTLPGIEALKH